MSSSPIPKHETMIPQRGIITQFLRSWNLGFSVYEISSYSAKLLVERAMDMRRKLRVFSLLLVQHRSAVGILRAVQSLEPELSSEANHHPHRGEIFVPAPRKILNLQKLNACFVFIRAKKQSFIFLITIPTVPFFLVIVTKKSTVSRTHDISGYQCSTCRSDTSQRQRTSQTLRKNRRGNVFIRGCSK